MKKSKKVIKKNRRKQIKHTSTFKRKKKNIIKKKSPIKKIKNINKKSKKEIKIVNKFFKHSKNKEKTQNNQPTTHKHGKKNIIETYEIMVDNTKVHVDIEKQKEITKYNLHTPQISEATNALLGEIRNELVTVTTISMQELLNPEAFASMKQRFMVEATKLIKLKLPKINPETEKFIVGRLIQDMLGLGKIEYLINDINLEEIVIPSSKEEIRVYSKKYGWISTNVKVKSEEEILNYANVIARRAGRQITVLSPLLDAHLVTGDRVNALLYPINTKGNTITIRKFSRDPLTVIDLIKNKTSSVESFSLIWLAMEYEMNILISGGTASGKTSFLNACLPFIPPNQRIISIEDTRELMLPEFLYWTPLVTRTPNAEGKGEVNMLDLLVNSLRMRPDRIVLGEMRRHQEAMVLFEAMHTGHSVYATVHADSAPETISRLTNPPLSVPPNLLKAVDLNVVMFRHRKKGIRRVLQVAEFEPVGEKVSANILYRWSPENDTMIKHSENSRFIEKINKTTGMSQKEIQQDLATKKRILEYLVKNNIRSLKEFGKIIDSYYIKKETVVKAINKKNLKEILE